MAIHAGLLFVRTDMSGGVLGQIGWEKPPGRYGDEGSFVLCTPFYSKGVKKVQPGLLGGAL
ncbi:hypothetical protein PENSUB_11071 [Penicillium subrubescens]|uniref:Uncharacterized protein n=1 Tax=Penicillium subrubescens TaxID=1316194 RepID=A0A1Q5T5P5_9EURO|nr:hypothetical protein PENSUB_11071 [Penicillium subrubescens]